ncbi:Hsp20/alpha crystallin family protein [Chloroflexota bacterium]
MIVDIFDEGDCIKIIAELPGVVKEDIRTELKDNLLIISGTSAFTKFHKEITLPCSVKDTLISSYRNGVLELKAEIIS